MSAVTLQTAGGLAVLTLDNVERHNAFDRAMLGQLDAHLDTVRDAEDVRAVILTERGLKLSALVLTSTNGRA